MTNAKIKNGTDTRFLDEDGGLTTCSFQCLVEQNLNLH
jgi:hypothetical protein